MANIKVNPNSFIPSGEMLRELATQSYISDADVRSILRQRGIYTSSPRKENTIPVLSCLLLTPTEFEIMVERQTIKEDNLKSAGSGKIKLNSNFSNLTDFIHNDYLPSLKKQLASDQQSLRNNYKVIGVPSIKTLIKDQEIEIEINIERNNYNKSWVNHKTQFKGIVNLKYVNNEIKFQRFFTSDETKHIVNKCVSIFDKTCKEKKVVDEKEIEHRVRFNDFSNEQRIKFLLMLYNSSILRSNDIEEDDVISFEFAPDLLINLPQELSWMENKEELIFRGKKVETTFFLNQPNYYKHLIVWRMLATYKFKIIGKGVEGNVKIDFNFHEYSKDKSIKAPLEINILSAVDIQNKMGYTQSQKELIKKDILTRFETIKDNIYSTNFSKR